MDAFLSYGFLQRALLAGVFVAIACALLGVFLILRKEAMIGHGLAHVAFAGVAIGFFLELMPLAAALFIVVFASLGILRLKEKAGLHGDTAIAIFSSAGFALGILLVTIAGNFNVDLFAYLFGEILAIAPAEVALSVALAVAVVLAVILNYKKFMYITFDREAAKASGIKVKKLDMMITILTAITVVLGMKVVGLLLIAALLVIPAAAGLQLASSFQKAVVLSSLFAVVSVVVGLFVSFSLDFPASGTIVLLSFLIFAFCYILKKERRFF